MFLKSGSGTSGSPACSSSSGGTASIELWSTFVPMIGTQWYESFYYLETKKGSGEYENRPGTKIGELTTARYGEGWEDDENIVLDPDDLPEFTFYCNLEPKTKFGSTEDHLIAKRGASASEASPLQRAFP
jgi:hypothetical protein